MVDSVDQSFDRYLLLPIPSPKRSASISAAQDSIRGKQHMTNTSLAQ